MRFPEVVRDSDDHGHSPVWAKPKRRSGGNPLVGLVVTLLALFGALTAVLGIKEQSVAEGGAMIDGWITTGWATVKGEAPAAMDATAEKAGDAAARTGDALQAGAATTAEELKRP